MAADIQIAIARIESPTSTGNQDYTNSAFGGGTPKGAIVIMSGHNVANDPNDTADVRSSIGAVDGTTDAACGIYSQDNVGNTNTDRTGVAAKVITMTTPASVVFLSGDFVSFITNGIRINWTTVQAASYRGYVILFGGSDFSCKAGVINLGTGTSPITTTTSIDQDAVFFFSTFAASTAETSGNILMHSAGFALADNTQKCFAWEEPDNAAAAAPAMKLHSALAASRQTAAGQFNVTSSNFTSTSFDVTPSSNTGNARLGYFAMQIGGGASPALWTFNTPTSTGNTTDNSMSGHPAFGMVIGTNLEVVDSGQGDDTAGGLGISAFTQTDQQAVSYRIDDAADPTDTASDAEAHAIMIASHNDTGAIEADFVGFGPLGWTLNYTAVQGNAKKAIAFGIGNITPFGLPLFMHHYQQQKQAA